MAERIFNRKTVFSMNLIAAFLFASLDILYYFIDIETIRIVVYAFLGLTVCFTVFWFGKTGVKIRFERKQILLIAFLGWYLIGCVIWTVTSKADYVSYNKMPLLDVAVTLLLFFPLGCVIAREKEIPGFCRIVLHGILWGWSAFLLVVLVTVFRGETIGTANGGVIGMKNYQFLYLNCYYNTTGMWEAIFTPLCCYFLFHSKKKSMKAVYALATLINYTALVLSNSRTATYSTMIGITAMVGIQAYTLISARDKKHPVLWAIGAAAAAGVIQYLLRQAIFNLYFDAVKSFTGDGEFAITGKIRDLSDYTVMTFTGRTDIWKYAVEIIFHSVHNALFGVTPINIVPKIIEFSQGKWDVYTHNQFLEIGVANGLVGLGLMVAWLIGVLKDIWRWGLVRKEEAYHGLKRCFPVLILILALAHVFESTLLYYGYISGYAFFFYCGLLHGTMNSPTKEKRKIRKKNAKA